jgi:hypothetical protein
MEAPVMKALGIIGTTVLFLLFGATVPAFAQDEHHDQEAKPEKQAAKPPQHEEPTKPAQSEKQAKPVQHEQPAKPVKDAKQAEPKKQEQAKPQKQATPEKQAKTEKPVQQNKQAAQKGNGSSAPQRPQHSATEQQRQRAVPALRLSARGQGHIPDDRFRSNFGQQHRFRISSPQIVDGYSRLQYSGFWFGFVEPWPDGWYYTDDVYVDYVDGGYYLYNPYYPGARVSISVVL